MNQRERFKNLMSFQKVDRIPYWDFGFLDETLERWYKEGLPRYEYPEKFFGMDRDFEESMVPVTLRMFPYFEETILEQDETTQIVINVQGIKMKRFRLKSGMYSIPHFIEFPVKNRKDFQEISKRFDYSTPSRYTCRWDDYKKGMGNRDYPAGIWCGGFFGWARDLMGLENLSIAFYEDKNLITEMFDFQAEFVLNVIRKAVEEMEIDYALFWEDMAYNKGSLLSPALFKELMIPRYRKITDFLRSHGVKYSFVDCDGNIEELVPLWMDAGINGFYPLEIRASSTPEKYRKKYGKNILLMGGMDKIELSKGKKAIDEEIQRRTEVIKSGGYIPFVDHRVPPEISLDDYLYYLKRIKEVGRFE